jgi:L-ascorbate metabolism protein UlaG (beta-lactamase superfamily)
MKKKFPLRENGRFYAENKRNHRWFGAICKTLWKAIKHNIFGDENDIAATWAVKPQFIARSEELLITWLGHSTFLIQVGGKNILTDPIFGRLTYIFSRIIPQVVSAQDFPKIDYVLLSHNHFDHMDGYALHDLQKQFPEMHICVPMGDKAWFDRRGFKHVSEHMWWDIIPGGAGVSFSFLPANHWSQRNLFDKNRSLWGSWMIQHNNGTVYFAGDTAWGDHFDEIAFHYPQIDVALMPIAPCEPYEMMQDDHVNTEEAGEAFLKLNAKICIPMHWGTYHLGLDTFKGPIDRLHLWWEFNKVRCEGKTLQLVKAGESVDFALTLLEKAIQKETTSSAVL